MILPWIILESCFLATAIAQISVTTTTTPALQCRDRDLSRIDPDTRQCRKACTSSEDCKSENKRCLCDGVCGASCYNPNASCDTLPQVSNGAYNPGEGIYGERVTLRCADRYHVNGTARRTCQSDRQWSGRPPSCIIGCVPPQGSSSAFPDATKQLYFVNEQLTFTCHPGFVLSGNPTVTCQDDGSWSTFNFLCSRSVCRNPTGMLDHGSFQGTDYTFGSRVTLLCDTGYELEGPPRSRSMISCHVGPVWSPAISSFQCRIVECDAPVAPEHGSVDTSQVDAFQYNERVPYACDQGYKLVGNDHGRCDENRSWGPLPVCEIDDDCGFEKLQRQLCGYQLSGVPWDREFSENVPNARRGYVLAATFPSRDAGTSSVLFSPMLPRDNFTCLQFYYQISAITEGRDFSVTIQPSNGTSEVIWTFNTEEQRSRWLDTKVRLPASNQMFRINFIVSEPSSGRIEVELDDIRVDPSSAGECVNECANSPCQNGGTCVNRINGYQCYCADGVKTTNCESEMPIPTSPVSTSTPIEEPNNISTTTSKSQSTTISSTDAKTTSSQVPIYTTAQGSSTKSVAKTSSATVSIKNKAVTGSSTVNIDKDAKLSPPPVPLHTAVLDRSMKSIYLRKSSFSTLRSPTSGDGDDDSQPDNLGLILGLAIGLGVVVLVGLGVGLYVTKVFVGSKKEDIPLNDSDRPMIDKPAGAATDGPTMVEKPNSRTDVV